jgi:hypothetical protein
LKKITFIFIFRSSKLLGSEKNLKNCSDFSTFFFKIRLLTAVHLSHLPFVVLRRMSMGENCKGLRCIKSRTILWVLESFFPICCPTSAKTCKQVYNFHITCPFQVGTVPTTFTLHLEHYLLFERHVLTKLRAGKTQKFPQWFKQNWQLCRTDWELLTINWVISCLQ